MINIWIFIIACIIFIGILIREFLHDKDMEDKYRALQEANEGLIMVLGYYSMRFGQITTEDLTNMVGIEAEKLRLKK